MMSENALMYSIFGAIALLLAATQIGQHRKKSRFAKLFIPGKAEPAYGGRLLSEWLTDINWLESINSGRPESPIGPSLGYLQASEALRHLKADLLPLLAIVRANDPCAELSIGQPGKRDPWAVKLLAGYTENALATFGMFGEDADSVIPELELLLRNGGTAGVAAQALAQLGPSAHSVLVRALFHSQPAVRAVVLDYLAEERNRKPEDFPLIRQGLSDNEPDVRYRAATVLAKNSEDSGLVLPLLIECIQRHPSERIGLFAVAALGQLGETARPALGALREVLAKSDGLMKDAITFALCRIDPATVTGLLRPEGPLPTR